MNIYLLTPIDINAEDYYDVYQGVVVCAKDEADAKTIMPDESEFFTDETRLWWPTTTADILCKEIGQANKKQKRGVVLASYRAG